MSAPKRMALAFCCTLLGVMSLGLAGTVPTAIRYGMRYAMPTLQMLPVYLLFALPGWILALPFVLLFKDAKGFRFWWILGIGTAIGPAFILTWTLLASRGQLNWNANGSAVIMSVWIGLFTSLFYALLLRRSTEKSALPE